MFCTKEKTAWMSVWINLWVNHHRINYLFTTAALPALNEEHMSLIVFTCWDKTHPDWTRERKIDKREERTPREAGQSNSPNYFPGLGWLTVNSAAVNSCPSSQGQSSFLMLPWEKSGQRLLSHRNQFLFIILHLLVLLSDNWKMD